MILLLNVEKLKMEKLFEIKTFIFHSPFKLYRVNKKRKIEREKKEKIENEDIIIGEKEVRFVLDNKKRITVHKFKGQIKVDIREFYDDNGEMKPGKKGISLSLDNWIKLKAFIDDIDESIDNMK